MADVLIGLVPMMLASAILPVWLILNLILLMGKNGVLRSAALIVGMTLGRIVQGFLGNTLFIAADEYGDGGQSALASTLLLALGLLFAITAVKSYLKTPDADDPPPKWMTMADSLTPAKSFLLGLGVLIAPKIWVFTLSAVGIIDQASPGMTQALVAFLLFLFASVILMLIPLFMYLVAPGSAAATLTRLRGWLERNTRVIMIILSVVFSLYFFYKGIMGFLG